MYTVPGKALEASSNSNFRRGLPAANNEWGPLTDLPDYSFPGKRNFKLLIVLSDGRVPKITTVGQRRRIIDQYTMTVRL